MNSDCCPFILRFSRSMQRQNPRIVRGGMPKPSPFGLPDRKVMAAELTKGFGFYRKFDYNFGLPVFNTLTLRDFSLSKSLRYHFLSTTGIRPTASLEINRLVFALSDSEALNRLNNQLVYGQGRNFLSSMSHIEGIAPLLPSVKIELSSPFECGLSDLKPDESVYIHTLPCADGHDMLIGFLKENMAAKNLKIHDLCGYTIIQTQIDDLKSRLDTLTTHSLVRSVSPVSTFIFRENYVRHGDLPLECISVRDTEKSYPRAAVVDSGIADFSYLKEWELDSFSFFNRSDRNPKHGTFVAGRLLNEGETFGGILYLNAGILPSEGSITLDEFHDRMDILLKKFHKTVKIYNISLGSDIPADTESFSAAAHVLDILQEKYDVLFVVSAGNYEPLRSDPFSVSEGSRVASPAESIHALTVGSVTHKETNVQSIHTPSLFTRHGPAGGYSVKPDVCAYGGTHEKRMGRLYPVGVYSIGTRNELAEDSGTSHAAPRVSALAAKLYHKYSHFFQSPDMAKAILLHYTHLRNRTSPDIFTGYGIVPDGHEGFEDMPNSLVYLHEGTVRHGNIIEIEGIPVPAGFFEKHKATGSIELTLVYKTKTNMNFPHFYSCTNLEPSLGFHRNGEWKSIITSKNLLALDLPGISRQKLRETFKWQPVKLYQTKLTSARIPSKLTLRITPYKRDFYTENTDIQYCIVLSFSHESKNMFSEMLEKYGEYDGILEPASKMWKTC